MCICFTLCVFVVPYVYLLYFLYVFLVPYIYLLYFLCLFVVPYVYLLYYVCTAVLTLDARLLARSQYPEDHCHRVTTQLQLINIIYIYIYMYIYIYIHSHTHTHDIPKFLTWNVESSFYSYEMIALSSYKIHLYFLVLHSTFGEDSISR